MAEEKGKRMQAWLLLEGFTCVAFGQFYQNWMEQRTALMTFLHEDEIFTLVTTSFS